MTYISHCKPIKISHPHEEIMMHMLANPGQTMKEVAIVFGYTPQTLYVLVHNDMFQARFNELKTEHFSQAAVGIRDKLEALGQMALDRWGEMIAESADPAFIKSSSDKILQRLGYGATNGAALNLTIGSSPSPHAPTRLAIETANRARLRLQELNRVDPSTAIEGEFHDVGQTGSQESR